MNKLAVRFNYGDSTNNKIFAQPLFYISENIRQALYKVAEDAEIHQMDCDEKIEKND